MKVSDYSGKMRPLASLRTPSRRACSKIGNFRNFAPDQNLFYMPVQKVPGGWRWGQSGKVYPTKAQAEAQGRAAYAAGYREKKPKK